MSQYIIQFRKIFVTTAQINLPIKQMFLSYKPTAPPQNLSPTKTHNPIDHSHKIVNFSSKCIPSFGV